MKSKNMTLMIIAIGCGLVAAFLTARLSGGSGPEKIEVIVAKKELPVGTLLEDKELENLLGTQKFEKASVPPDVIINAEELKGKRLNRTMKQGNFFSPTDVAADSGIKIPDGMFKYAIRTDGIKAAAGFVQPGDKVDVVLTESLPNGKAKSGMFLRDMLVLAVDASTVRREQAAVLQVNSVSLAVTSEQSLYLSNAEKRGEVKLVLRDSKNPDKHNVSAKSVIPGFDSSADDATPQTTGPAIKTATVVVAKTDVPVNTLITKDNWTNYFEPKEYPEEAVPSKAVKEPNQLWDKYVTRAMEAEMPVYAKWLSENKAEGSAVATAEGSTPFEILPMPKEKAAEQASYPRKFVQMIDSRLYYFIETAPGTFERVDNATPDFKSLPPAKDQRAAEDGGRNV